ncbi:MAG: DMT family transporter [Desulfamplus sp.]|nr:DMT family transporter [Desulfamplus sp.]
MTRGGHTKKTAMLVYNRNNYNTYGCNSLKVGIAGNKAVKAYMLLTVAVFSWALNTVLAKGMINEIEPMTLSFFRWFSALCFILPFGLKRVLKEKEILRQNYIKIVILSIFSISLYNSLIYCSARFTTATNMSFVIAATPATTFIVSWIFLRQKESFPRILGMLLSLGGMLLIVFKGNINNLLSLVVNPGDLLAFGAVVSWAIYSVLLAYMKLDIDRVAFLTITIITGLPFILPFYLHELSEYGLFAVNIKNISIILFLGIFPSIVSYLCWNEGVKRAGPNMASIFLYLIPVVASLVAFFFLGERIHLYHIAGGLLILGGLVLYCKQT